MSEASAEGPEQAEVPAISEIAVSGFKSLRDECRIAIRPLTILAGANSSGKSSIMQPLLMMKQTLQASHDPGALLMFGDLVQFRNVEEALSRGGAWSAEGFAVTVDAGRDGCVELPFRAAGDLGFGLEEMTVCGAAPVRLRLGMHPNDIVNALPERDADRVFGEHEHFGVPEVVRDRCFLDVRYSMGGVPCNVTPVPALARHVARALHLPGTRGEPARDYAALGLNGAFPGTFPAYAASLVMGWAEHRSDRLSELAAWLRALGMTGGISAARLDATRIELRVGRTRNGRQEWDSMVNLADVGLGVSQTLPVLVALLAAGPGQLVHIEQPELHLHPKAQLALGGILVQAAKRGIRAVIETHSDLLLLGLQTAAARGELAPEEAVLHWFERDDEGVTHVTTGELDEAGRYGDWPEDFGKVALRAETDYLSEAERHLFGTTDEDE